MFDKTIEKEVEKIKNEIIEWRRFFHMYPELGFEEFKTSEKIQEVLKDIGINYEVKGKTGVVGYINKGAKITIGIRADMDALPIKEETNLDFSSRNEGIMHACGHDGHMATLLGIAKILSKFLNYLKCNVKFIFQPCEEKPPGGAFAIIKDKVLEDVNYMIGFHFYPLIPLYKIYIEKGTVMANTDRFKLIIEGKGGHASSPHLTNDPIVCSSYIINAIQTIISRKLNIIENPAVISICKINGGEAFNIIPEKVEIEGTVRTLSEKTRNIIKKEMRNMTQKVASSFNCKTKLVYECYSPSVKNDSKLTEMIERISRKILPKKYFYKYHPIMGGEDFAFYSKIVPSVYIFIGIGKKCGVNHSSKFTIDERILPFSVKYFSQLILNFV
ncbi:MAG: amidohydrolase [Candidatus Omnitrophica bacterium]|nr:amidohydrolase [Candidatus Omnitrophota bacterium]MCM8806429.1 amidohydrolase [Candidatus Omnitrophota bacterium]